MQHNLAHGKCQVHQVGTQGSEKLGVMVEHPWPLTRDTTIYRKLLTCM